MKLKYCFLMLILAIILAACSIAQPAPTATPTTAPSPTPEPQQVVLQYLGHACFLLIAPDGTRIVMDAYDDSMIMAGLEPIPADIQANAVTRSHTHPDHYNFARISGSPQKLTTFGTNQIGAVKVTGYESKEGSPTSPTGESSLDNIVFVFEVGDIKIVHMGDAGSITQAETLAAMQGADVVLVNVDGYVMPLDQVVPQLQALDVKTIVPIHYRLKEEDRIFALMSILDDFLAVVPADLPIVKETGSELNVIDGMPKQILVLTPLLLSK